MNTIKDQLSFVYMLWRDLETNAHKYLKGSDNGEHPYNGSVWMNKNYGKYVIKRKITALRQELLNLEKMIDG